MIGILAMIVALVTSINAFIGYESLRSFDKTAKTLDLVTSVAGPAAQKRQSAVLGQIIKSLQDHETNVVLAECQAKARQLTDLATTLGGHADLAQLTAECQTIAKTPPSLPPSPAPSPAPTGP